MLLPARFHCFRTATKGCLEEKVQASRVFGAFDRDGNLLALVFRFDTEFPNPSAVAHAGITFGEGSGSRQAAVLMLRCLAGHYGESVAARIGAGPFDNSGCDGGGAGDVGEVMTGVMAEAGLERALESHLRIYKVPRG